MKKIILFVFILYSSALFSQTVIQMKREGGVSIIPCKVNGLKLSFIFDTGASDVTISLTEASFMLKNGYLTKDDIIGTSNYSDANGDISEGININLREIDIQGLTLYNVKASIVKNMDAPLLLGQSAISKLGTIQLNLIENTLTLINRVKSYDFLNHTQKNNLNTKEVIIGRPKRIENLLVAEFDLPVMLDWGEAKKRCISLGKGWRLPTEVELNLLYQNKDIIGGFKDGFYWSSNKCKDCINDRMCVQLFSNGIKGQHLYNVGQLYNVRAVRTL